MWIDIKDFVSIPYFCMVSDKRFSHYRTVNFGSELRQKYSEHVLFIVILEKNVFGVGARHQHRYPL